MNTNDNNVQIITVTHLENIYNPQKNAKYKPLTLVISSSYVCEWHDSDINARGSDITKLNDRLSNLKVDPVFTMYTT